VLYPGLESHPQYELARRQMSGCSGLLSFVPVGGDNDIRRFTKALQLFEEGPSWGGYESILNTPGVGISVERSKTEGIPMGLVRISIGLENSESLLDDLDQGIRSL
jgi:cystathionine beta-lyase/cystathionine gamma-synthase